MVIGLFGAGGFGREVLAMCCDARDVVFVVDHDDAPSEVNNRPVLHISEFNRLPGPRLFNIAVADSAARQRIAERLIVEGADPTQLKAKNAIVSDHAKIDDGAILCAGTIICPDATIGRFFHANLNSYVAHDCIIGDYVTFAPAVCCNGRVVVEDHAYIGTGAVLREGGPEKPLRIGRGAIIGMGAVVTKDVPAGETWVGNPARPIERKPTR